MLETIVTILLVIYIIGYLPSGILFMRSLTSQDRIGDFTLQVWGVSVVLWPVAWAYILIRVHNDDRARRREKEHRECERGVRLCPKHFREKKFGEATGIIVHPLEDGQRIVEGVRWRDE